MVVITGAAGFIGSCLVTKLNQEGIADLILVDDFSIAGKQENFQHKSYRQKIERDVFIDWFRNHAADISFIYHIGARTDTTEFNKSIFDALNVNYTKAIWEICTTHAIPMVYASSAATYGLGEFGYKDDEQKIPLLKPLNPYGESKQAFDTWALQQHTHPPIWAGFKFFNVYGPNEYHKGRMASVIFHAFHQVQKQGIVRLFRSHRPDYADGGQLRDFVYVKDVVEVLYHAYKPGLKNGIYNLGSGKARTFSDLAKATFKALDREPVIEYIDTPADIRDKYQYFTEADMQKLANAGYVKPFTGLEAGVEDYVKQYLVPGRYY